ncbi:MAG: phosphate transporter substrate-binding protein [Glaciihabitans sp.]|jgi:phosphate transport system substrate-binding protein|nr:phosphate transporter substrate-binding protein [Glaciihabitans sp.]
MVTNGTYRRLEWVAPAPSCNQTPEGNTVSFTRFGSIAVVAVAAALVLSSCASNEGTTTGSTGSPSALTGTLSGIGSSAQGTAETAWAAGFQGANSGVTVNYNPQGSGAGRTAFLGGQSDFAGSDAALKDTELATQSPKCAAGTKPIDLPVYISPIAIVFNIAGVTTLKLDAPTIAGIFSGKVTTWNDKQITAQNAGVTLPSAKINVVHRGDDSGTTQNFTDYLSANAPTVWTAAPAQTFPYKIGDAATGSSGVAAAVKSAKNSIAYLDNSAATGLASAQLKVGATYNTISAAGAADVVAKSPIAAGRAANDLAIAIDRKNTDANAWPNVLVSYLIVCQTYKDKATGTLVAAYAKYVASADGQAAAAKQASSAPLATDLAAKVAASIATIK